MNEYKISFKYREEPMHVFGSSRTKTAIYIAVTKDAIDALDKFDKIHPDVEFVDIVKL